MLPTYCEIESLERRTYLFCQGIGEDHLKVTVFNDANANRLRDPGEVVMPEWPVDITTIDIDRDPFREVERMTTDGSGEINLDFPVCGPSPERVASASVDGWRATSDGVGLDVEIGVTQRALVGGMLFNDMNGDGK